MRRTGGRIEMKVSEKYMQDPFSAKGSVTADIYRRRHVMLADDACAVNTQRQLNYIRDLLNTRCAIAMQSQ
jgi:hypothetical protein